MVGTANDVRDSHVDVIDDHAQMIGWHAIGSQEDKILYGGKLVSNWPKNFVLKLNAAAARNLEADDPRLATLFPALDLFGRQCATRAIIFPGKSGAGKSAITRLLNGGTNFELLSDDRIIVREMNDHFEVFGTPWPGEAGISVNRSAALEGILFLAHGSENRINALNPKESLKRLLPT